jgi:hypothetical protein
MIWGGNTIGEEDEDEETLEDYDKKNNNHQLTSSNQLYPIKSPPIGFFTIVIIFTICNRFKIYWKSCYYYWFVLH